MLESLEYLDTMEGMDCPTSLREYMTWISEHHCTMSCPLNWPREAFVVSQDLGRNRHGALKCLAMGGVVLGGGTANLNVGGWRQQVSLKGLEPIFSCCLGVCECIRRKQSNGETLFTPEVGGCPRMGRPTMLVFRNAPVHT